MASGLRAKLRAIGSATAAAQPRDARPGGVICHVHRLDAVPGLDALSPVGLRRIGWSGRAFDPERCLFLDTETTGPVRRRGHGGVPRRRRLCQGRLPDHRAVPDARLRRRARAAGQARQPDGRIRLRVHVQRPGRSTCRCSRRGSRWPGCATAGASWKTSTSCRRRGGRGSSGWAAAGLRASKSWRSGCHAATTCPAAKRQSGSLNTFGPAIFRFWTPSSSTTGRTSPRWRRSSSG